MEDNAVVLSIIDDIILGTRRKRGVDVIPLSVTAEEVLRVARLVDVQYRVLKKAKVILGYEEITKRVCEAQTFSNDFEENWVLQYAYQLLAMPYFGYRSKKNAGERRNQKLDRASQGSTRR